jgi:hypothetical protein
VLIAVVLYTLYRRYLGPSSSSSSAALVRRTVSTPAHRLVGKLLGSHAAIHSVAVAGPGARLLTERAFEGLEGAELWDYHWYLHMCFVTLSG